MRLVAPTLLVISTTCFLQARPRISGYCEQGGQVVVTSAVQSVTKVQQSYPSCTITVYYTGGATGTVTTNGPAVTLVNGPPFGNWANLTIQINGIPYTVQSVTDPAHLTLTGSAGPQTAVPFVAGQPTPAPIYSDNNGTPLAGNSFNASGTGYWFFYADNGTYDVKMTGGGIPQPFTWGAISAIDPLQLPLTISDRLFTTFQSACNAATAAGKSLTVSQQWLAVPSLTCSAPLIFVDGGSIQPATSALVNLITQSAPTARICDGTLGGFCNIAGGQGTAFPEWWGALGSGIDEDSAAIQTAVNTCQPLTFTRTYLIGTTIQMNCTGQSITFVAGAMMLKNGIVDGWQVNSDSNKINGLTINGNGFADSGLGIFGSHNEVRGGHFYNNGAGGHGVYFDGQTSLGHHCDHNLILGIRSNNNGGIGIAENTCPDNRIEGNETISNGLEGITVDVVSHRAVVVGNHVEGNCTVGASGGIGTDDSNNIVIVGNTIIGSLNGCDGVRVNNHVGSSTGGTISGNTISNNTGWGVHLATAGPYVTTKFATVGNSLLSNTTGPYSSDSGSNDNIFSGNTWDTGNPGGATVNGINVIDPNILSLFAGSLQNTLDGAGRLQMKGAYSDQSYVVIAPTNGFSQVVGGATGALIIDPATPLASGSVEFPTTPVDGMIFSLSSTQAISTLTLTAAAGQTIKDAPASIGTGGSFIWHYIASSGNWYLISGNSGTSSTSGGLRQLATGSFANDTTGTTPMGGIGFQYFMSRSAHYARVPISSLAIVIGNYALSEATSTGIGVFQASVEYPAGTFTQVTWNGSPTGTSSSTLSLLTSDTISLKVNIPRNALFWIRIHGNEGGTNGNYFPHGNSVLSEGFTYGNTPQTDLTMTGTVAYSNYNFKPLAIIGNSSEPSVCLIGDSRVQGLFDTPDNTGNLGTLARSIGRTLPYISLAAQGSPAWAYVANNTLRSFIVQNYCTSYVVAYGINDLATGYTTPATETALSAISALYPGQQGFIATIEPETTSTDMWATTTNQTVTTDPSTLNTWIRTVQGSYVGFFEIANVDAPGNKWLVNGTANYATADGVHETRSLLQVLSASGAINPAVFAK